MRRIFVTILLLSLKLSAAAPLMHLYAAELWNNHVEGFSKEEKRAFFLGNLFPDIRYLAEIPREKTHFYGVTFHDVKEHYSPFTKGMVLHSVLDEFREQLVVESGIYTILEEVEGEHLFECLLLLYRTQ